MCPEMTSKCRFLTEIVPKLKNNSAGTLPLQDFIRLCTHEIQTSMDSQRISLNVSLIIIPNFPSCLQKRPRIVSIWHQSAWKQGPCKLVLFEKCLIYLRRSLDQSLRKLFDVNSQRSELLRRRKDLLQHWSFWGQMLTSEILHIMEEFHTFLRHLSISHHK